MNDLVVFRWSCHNNKKARHLPPRDDIGLGCTSTPDLCFFFFRDLYLYVFKPSATIDGDLQIVGPVKSEISEKQNLHFLIEFPFLLSFHKVLCHIRKVN